MTFKMILRGAQMLALCAPLLAHAQSTDPYWTKDRIRDAKIASFDAETALDNGQRLAALEVLVTVFPEDGQITEIPAQIDAVMGLLERAYFGYWVRLNGTHAFDFAMISPDESHLLTQKTLEGGINELALWNTASGDEVTRLTGNYKVSAQSMPAFSHDGTRLALMIDETTLGILDTANGQLLHQVTVFNFNDTVDYWYGRLQFSPDGRQVLVNGGDYRTPFSLVDTASGQVAYRMAETEPRPTLRFANGVVPFEPSVLVFRGAIDAAMRDSESLCISVTEAATRDNDWRTNEIENAYLGILETASNTITFDNVLEGRRMADDALECHPSGPRLVKTVIDPELAKEDEFDEGATLITNGRIFATPRDNSQWMSGFSFSPEGDKAALNSNRPAVIDTSNGELLAEIVIDGVEYPGTVFVIDGDGNAIGSGFTTTLRDSYYNMPFSPAELIDAARAELAAQ